MRTAKVRLPLFCGYLSPALMSEIGFAEPHTSGRAWVRSYR